MVCDMPYTPNELDELRRLLVRLKFLRGRDFDLNHAELIHVTNQTDLGLLDDAVKSEAARAAKDLADRISFDEDFLQGRQLCLRDEATMHGAYARYFSFCAGAGIPADEAVTKASLRWTFEGLTPADRAPQLPRSVA
jgi:hypothetical protein